MLRRRRRAPPTWPARRAARGPRRSSASGSPARRRRARRATCASPGTTSTFTVVDRGRRLGDGDAADPRAPLRPRRAGRARRRAAARASASTTCARGLGRFTGTRRRMELKGEVGGVRVYDSYAHHPDEIAGDLAGGPRAGGRGPRRRRLPAAPGLAHPDLRRRDGRGARRRRRGRGAGRLRRPRGPRARRHRRAGRRRRAAARRARAPSSRPGRATAGDLVERARPGDLVLTLGAGDVTLLGPEVLELLAERGARARCSAATTPTAPTRRRRTASATDRLAAQSDFARRQWAAPLAGAGAASLVAARCSSARGRPSVWLVFFSSVLAVAGVEVDGTDVLDAARGRVAAAAVPDRRRRWPASTSTAIRARVEALRRGRVASRSRGTGRDTVRIEVTERTAGRGGRPAAAAARPGRRRACCSATTPPAPGEPAAGPRSTADDPRRGARRGAPRWSASLPGAIAARVDHVEVADRRHRSRCGCATAARSCGGARRSSAEKAEVLAVLLRQPASDVRRQRARPAHPAVPTDRSTGAVPDQGPSPRTQCAESGCTRARRVAPRFAAGGLPTCSSQPRG